MRASTWRLCPADPARAASLAEALGLHPLTGQLLVNRRLTQPSAAARFLHPGLETMGDPLALPEMPAAIERLRRAIAARESILIFGDSDADGLTASVILYETLRAQGASVRARQSNRITDGYGLPRAFLKPIARSGVTLVILVDCGTNQSEEVRLLADEGIDTIILDHHVPLEAAARPFALVNPHCAGPEGRELCSAGLAIKMAQALWGPEAKERLLDCLDLGALGTLADYSPMTGESRAILAEGMPRIVHSRRPGLQRLCDVTSTNEPEPEQILRKLVPKINASGRLGDASPVWRMLLDGEQPVDDLLKAMDAAHAETRELQRHIIGDAHEQVRRLHFKDEYVVVVSRAGWHQGLMGPLAAQLAQQYGRPAIAIAMDERQGTGSGRSIPLFNLLQALRACQGFLVRFGGHAQACGLTVDRKQLDRFRAVVNEHARSAMGPDGLVPTRVADLELPVSAISAEWVREAAQFAPFGPGNPRPTVLIRDVSLEMKSPRTGSLVQGSERRAARGMFEGLVSGGRYDVLASPSMTGEEVTLSLVDVKGAAAPLAPGLSAGTTCTPAAV